MNWVVGGSLGLAAVLLYIYPAIHALVRGRAFACLLVLMFPVIGGALYWALQSDSDDQRA